MSATSLRILITGANAGIGRAAALQLAEAGHRVLMGCRSVERGEAARRAIVQTTGSSEVELVQVDLSLQSSVRDACAELLETHAVLDGVIHNAAFFDIGQKERTVTDEGIETTWATNHLGPVLMTELLLPALRAAPQGRVLTVSSKGLVVFPWLRVDLDDPELERGRFSVQRAYYQSKLAQICWTLHLAERLADSRVTANAIRVPNVAVDLERYPDLSWAMRTMYAVKKRLSISPEQMARTYVHLATSPELADTAGVHFDERAEPVTLPRAARDREHRRAVVAVTHAELAFEELHHSQ